MTTTDLDTAPKAARWSDLALVGLVALLLFIPGLGARDLWAPNEPNFAEAVSEMHARGDYLVPVINGSEFPEKPILYYWLGLISTHATGTVNELTLRLPLAAIGIASVLACYLLVLPYAGPTRARLAALLLATTWSVYWTSRSIQMDLLVMFFTLCTILIVTRIVDYGFPPWRGWALAGIAAGLGFLSKGPVAIVLPSIGILLYLATARKLGALRSWSLTAAIASCAAVTAPWYLALYATGHREFLVQVLWRQNVTRYLEAWDHRQPWWYFLAYFWVVLAPWAAFAPLALRLPGRDAGRRALDRLAWVWIIGVVGFFSLSQSKRGPYLIPAAPAVAIVVAGLLEKFWNGDLSARRRRAVLGLLLAHAIVLLAGGAWALARVPGMFPPLSWHAAAFGLLVICGGAAMLLGFLPSMRAGRLTLAAFASTMAVLYLMASVWLVPAVDPYKSARGFMARLNEIAPREESLALYRLQMRLGEYCFYAQRLIPNLESKAQLRGYLESPGEKVVVIEEERAEDIASILGDVSPLMRQTIGGDTFLVFAAGDDRLGAAETPRPDRDSSPAGN